MAGGEASEVVGRRVAAALLDIVLLGIVLVLVGLISGQSHASNGSASVSLHGAGALIYFVIDLAYFIIGEGAYGQTVGKRLMGIRVVAVGGGKASWGAVVGRTLLRIVDFLPFFYLLGFISVLVTGKRSQRIGDLAAGTTVIAARP